MRPVVVRDSLNALFFLAPAFFLYAIFVIYPTLDLFRFSFTSWDGVAPTKQWVGVANYRELFSDKIFWQSFKNTLVWTTIVLFINVFIALIIAALLAEPIRGRVWFQLAYFLPAVQAGVVTATIWRWMYQPQGVLNTFLRTIGLGQLARGWLGDFNFALPALAIAGSWMSIGVNIAIFLGSIQNIDPSLYESAKIDGATRFQLFRYITVPSLYHTIVIVLILSTIGAFKTFDIVWATTQGGPVRATELLATYMYKKGMLEVRYGYGSAIAVVLMLLIISLSAFYLFQRKGEM
ncbi:MAG: sugar ABC transporter permease [Candidatus Hadarchaeales archaeon]